MSRVAIIAVASALSLHAIGAPVRALAADMPSTLPPAYERPLPPPRAFDFNTGWYLRGDLGYNWGRIQGAQSATPFPSPTDSTLNGAVFAGVGAGIKTQWVRTDVTIDYALPMKYEGSILKPNDTTAKITAASVMFNGYLDLGTWYGATPYLGAGAGAAWLKTFDYSSTAAPPFTGDTIHKQWNFAWAVMAGVGYAVAPNLMVDVGYRYIDFGDVRTNADALGAMTFKNIAAHEVRVGLRWSFDDLYQTR